MRPFADASELNADQAAATALAGRHSLPDQCGNYFVEINELAVRRKHMYPHVILGKGRIDASAV